MRKILYILLLLPFVVKSQTKPLQPVQMPQATMYYDLATKHRWVFNGLTYQYFDFGQYQPYNQVLSGLNLSVVGSTLTVSTGSWNISNIVYTLSSPANFTLQARDTIYSRYETVYADSVNNGIHIAVGALSPNPVEPSIPHGDLRVGAVLITPTGTIIVPPGPVNQFVLSNPLTQQNATPWTRTYRTDTLTIAGKYTFPSIDGTSAQVLQTDGSGHLYWSSQAIYTPGFGLNLNAQAFSVDTTKIVTTVALLDTLRKNAAHFDTTQFSIVNDTIHCIACGGSGGSDTTLYKLDDSIHNSDRTVNLKAHTLEFSTYIDPAASSYFDIGPGFFVGSAYDISGTGISSIVGGDATGTAYLKSNDDQRQSEINAHPDNIFISLLQTHGAWRQQFTIDTISGGKYYDTKFQRGINYSGIAFSNFQDSTLVPKKWVVDNFAAIGSGSSGANPTATAGTSAVNGSATTFMRSDAAPKVDSAVFRTTANSLTLAQTQTALNAKQATLVSGTNIKTVNSNSLVGSGNVSVGTVTSITPGIGFVSHTAITGSGTMDVDTVSTISTKYYASVVVGPDGIVSGMSPTTISGTTATVPSGVYRLNNLLITKASSTNVTIDAQDATLNRYDLIVGDASGVLTKVSGTLGADAAQPDVPANKALIAYIYIPATGGTVVSGGGGGKGTTQNALSGGYGIVPFTFNGGTAGIKVVGDTTSSTGLVSKGRLSTNLGGYLKKTDTTAMLANVVHIAGSETITGSKTFTPKQFFTGNVLLNTTSDTTRFKLQVNGRTKITQYDAAGTNDSLMAFNPTTHGLRMTKLVAGSGATVTYGPGTITIGATGTSLTAGRGILLPSTVIILDTTQNYTWLKAQTITKNSLGTTPTNGFNLINSTLSTSGVTSQYAPAMHWQGHGWGSADNYIDWQEYPSVSGNTSSMLWRYSSSSTSTPSYSTMMSLDQSGKLTVNGVISGNSSGAAILQDGSGNQIFRGLRANAWTDSQSSVFFELGNTGNDNAFFTTGNGVQFSRLGFAAISTQIVNSTFSSANVPQGSFEISDGTSGQFNVFSNGGLKGSYISTPTAVKVFTLTTGGSIPAQTTYYKIVAYDVFGKPSGVSSEVSVTSTGSTSSNTLSWLPVNGAYIYRIYRGTSAAGENAYFTSTTASFLDTNGSGTGTSGTPPTSITSSINFIGQSITSTGNLGVGTILNPQVLAAANNDVLVGTYVRPNFSNYNGASTGTISGGSSYTNGTYTNVKLTGGSGSDAYATIVVSGNTVTAVTITSGYNGHDYKVGDVLSANAGDIGGTGSGFTWTLTALNFTGLQKIGLEIGGNLAINADQTAVNASTSGTVTYSQPIAGTSYKKVIAYCNAANGTASYTFPVPFTNTPAIVTTNGPASSVVTSLSTTAVTITGSSTTGFIILEGY